MTTDEFQRTHWEKEPLLVKREDPSYYSGILTVKDVDRIISLSNANFGDLRIVRDGTETPISSLASGGEISGTNVLARMYEHYRDGSTIVLNSLQQRWEPLQRLTRSLGEQVGARFAANVYVTPGGGRALAPHYDVHDVFVAQVHGTKRWRLHKAQQILPLKSNPFHLGELDPSEPWEEFNLETGDLLYLPRGTIHSAVAEQTGSVHVAIGVHPVAWATILEEAVQKAFESEVGFRTSLPMGFHRDSAQQDRIEAQFEILIDTLRKQLSPRALRVAALQRAASISHPVLTGHLIDLEQVDQVSLSTRVRLRAGVRYAFQRADDVAGLSFHNKTLRLPADLSVELEFILQTAGGSFTADEVPGDLDEGGRLVLLRKLIREGFLSID
ncbi:cupin domain-containing protein [Actinomadura rupiterrae]|uniref:cupin domain-containing protein n=1 Tax=Actinomadura rupiterrae TaxID=559627 RepID=UPI0020A3D91C|nr:cupin domain-containing protein [Actinomadura rupiterrae]MCP2343172.1 ribosomal protein L16 Arg81 hydroxylase [Actinomadura rupiterrae]